MGLYEAAKDALKVAQQLDNIELVQRLLDVQKMALDMQEKQQQDNATITSLETEIQDLKAIKKLQFADGHKHLIDPVAPDRPLCPVCSPKNKTPVPLNSIHQCSQCKGVFH
jgi:hypothetical protein